MEIAVSGRQFDGRLAGLDRLVPSLLLQVNAATQIMRLGILRFRCQYLIESLQAMIGASVVQVETHTVENLIRRHICVSRGNGAGQQANYEDSRKHEHLPHNLYRDTVGDRLAVSRAKRDRVAFFEAGENLHLSQIE
jgi:hypothetical protein